MDAPGDANAEIELIRSEVESAADAMLSAATHGLGLVNRARAGDATAYDELDATFLAILEACAFQDLTGQRLSRLKGRRLEVVYSKDALLQGPAAPAGGLRQEDADRLMGAKDGG